MRLRKRVAFVSCPPLLGLALLGPVVASNAQEQARRVAVNAPSIPVALDWTPPALASVGERAIVKNSFVFDRTMLAVAAGLLPQSEAGAKQSIRKLDGVAVHLYRFQDESDIDPAQLEEVRRAYHVHGWEHLVSPGDKIPSAKGDADKGALLQKGKTDLWLALDGIDVRGGTLLVVTPRSVSLVTFAGDLNPIDLLRLRGHFGIPNFSGDKFDEVH
jgi:hypothetical protein